jgi:preprotein translocase subunit SecD
MNIKRKLQTSPILIGITLAGGIEILKTADRPSQLLEALEKAKTDVKNFTHVAIARGFNLATKPVETRKAARKPKDPLTAVAVEPFKGDISTPPVLDLTNPENDPAEKTQEEKATEEKTA